MNEKQNPETSEAETKPRARGVQRKAGSTSAQAIKAALRKKILSIRAGHTTGGYCDTEALINEEKKLHAILATELEAAEKKHGTHHRSELQHPEVRAIKVELAGLAYKPRLVVEKE